MSASAPYTVAPHFTANQRALPNRLSLVLCWKIWILMRVACKRFAGMGVRVVELEFFKRHGCGKGWRHGIGIMVRRSVMVLNRQQGWWWWKLGQSSDHYIGWLKQPHLFQWNLSSGGEWFCCEERSMGKREWDIRDWFGSGEWYVLSIYIIQAQLPE